MPGFVSLFTSFKCLAMMMMTVMVRMVTVMMMRMVLTMRITFIRLELIEKSEAVIFEGRGL